MNELLMEILQAREDRANKQKLLLAQYQKPLLCFTMNIPGPKKLDRDVSVGFFVGSRLLTDALSPYPVLYREERRPITGCEGYYVVDMPAKELKALAIELEDIDPIGRLFDLDVLDTDGRKLSREELGYPRRKCLLCDNDAMVCASTRAHKLEELTDRTGFLLYLAARNWLSEYIGAKAYGALLLEVSTTPKPGLVDRNNKGAHRDMGMKHFFASANALRSYLCKFAESGYLNRDLPAKEAFSKLRTIGMEAEQAMLKATHGVNTHKGAIFSLGLLCAAAGRVDPFDWSEDLLLDQCAAMTADVLEDFTGITKENAQTEGERLFAAYGITGVRGQAKDGFPAVKDVGLPVFRKGLQQSLSVNDAGCCTLLHLIAATDDTNLIRRSDRQTQLDTRQKIAQLLKKTPYPALPVIEELDKDFIQKNLSPGGSADLLAMTYFLYSLT
ncbi:MAG: triphosphoribosyl-dephospho-CoA synthase CitG [Oscillospiraceae bacterium]|nr:triphosphoribosyl-dephospho-CoA synthase CitG [Oscillospiraceae bacterium]